MRPNEGKIPDARNVNQGTRLRHVARFVVGDEAHWHASHRGAVAGTKDFGRAKKRTRRLARDSHLPSAYRVGQETGFSTWRNRALVELMQLSSAYSRSLRHRLVIFRPQATFHLVYTMTPDAPFLQVVNAACMDGNLPKFQEALASALGSAYEDGKSRFELLVAYGEKEWEAIKLQAIGQSNPLGGSRDDDAIS
ncbi:hypothetical protein BO78DRAFT_388310 [Aspergillus sclerotiicarbonarius CBS 121057]|uniref:Uncharacterized protein n=1 Tax=Aspergillus sclerotiicarbonarius (strain CBS 121057 / IBT 28362) TaxID=1448318 RepID=A0A319ETM4_ASPSB|nr:hypothetical protein BO78DRAFT_388310 [Aspergillus sclerotiicarbonarius CBS 121057]